MTIVNYEVVFRIPVNLRNDTYVVSSENFLQKFNSLFEEYEQLDAEFSVTIKHTDTQIIS